MTTLRFLSLYSGAGLMDQGFEEAGFECVGAVEFEPPHRKPDGTCAKNAPRQWAVETWKKNRPGLERLSCNRDVCLVLEALRAPGESNDQEIRDLVARLRRTPANVLIGGPPCQGFSLAGKRKGRFDPEKGGLAWVMIEIAEALGVELAVFENVEGLGTTNGGDDLKLLMRAWRDAGFVPHIGTFNTADFGVAQLRKRIIIFAVRGDVAKRLGAPLWPQPTHSETPAQASLFSDGRKLPWVTVRQAIGDLPEPEESWYPLNKNDRQRALGREAGKDGGGEGLHEPDRPARAVRARKENYVPLPDGSVKNLRSGNVMGMDPDQPANAICAGEAKGGDRSLMVKVPNHRTGKAPNVPVTETADGRPVAGRNRRTVGISADKPSPSMRTDVGHGDRGFLVKVPSTHGVVDPDAPSIAVPNHEAAPLTEADAQYRIRQLDDPKDGRQGGIHEAGEPAKTVPARRENFLLENHEIGPKSADPVRVSDDPRHKPQTLDKPARTVCAEWGEGVIEGSIHVANHDSPHPMDAREQRRRLDAQREKRVNMGMHELDKPARTVCGSHQGENFLKFPSNHTPFIHLNQAQVERVLGSGKFNPARADRPSPTIKATMHKGGQNDEPYVVETGHPPPHGREPSVPGHHRTSRE